MNPQALIDEWTPEYIENRTREIQFKGWSRSVPSDWVGMTSFKSPLEIRIAHYFEDHNFWSEVILWHEFAHCWAFLDYGDKDHGIAWLKCILHRPAMFLLQVPCVFVAVFLKD